MMDTNRREQTTRVDQDFHILLCNEWYKEISYSFVFDNLSTKNRIDEKCFPSFRTSLLTRSATENLPSNTIKDLSTSFTSYFDFSFVSRWKCHGRWGLRRRIRSRLFTDQIIIGIMFQFNHGNIRRRCSGHPREIFNEDLKWDGLRRTIDFDRFFYLNHCIEQNKNEDIKNIIARDSLHRDNQQFLLNDPQCVDNRVERPELWHLLNGESLVTFHKKNSDQEVESVEERDTVLQPTNQWPNPWTCFFVVPTVSFLITASNSDG